MCKLKPVLKKVVEIHKRYLTPGLFKCVSAIETRKKKKKECKRQWTGSRLKETRAIWQLNAVSKPWFSPGSNDNGKNYWRHFRKAWIWTAYQIIFFRCWTYWLWYWSFSHIENALVLMRYMWKYLGKKCQDTCNLYSNTSNGR